MADLNDYNGRRPSFDKRGEVRGFRSRPGAPMADPTTNIPMSPDRMTSPKNWNDLFQFKMRPAPTSTAPGQPPVAVPPPSSTSAVDTALSEIWGSNNDFSAGVGSPAGVPALPPLNILAAGGPTHAQSWGGDSLVSTPPTSLFGRSFKNRYGTGSVNFDKRLSGGYGWGSNSRVT